MLRGADLFTRGVRADDDAWATYTADYESLKTTTLTARAECEAWTNAWNANQMSRSQENADKVNTRCAEAERQRVAFNEVHRQYVLADIRRNQRSSGTHPDSQTRVSSVAASLDALEERRDLDSMKDHANAYNVFSALVAIDSALLSRSSQEPSGVAPPSLAPAPSSEPRALKDRLADLKEALEAGLITQQEHDAKRASLLAET